MVKMAAEISDAIKQLPSARGHVVLGLEEPLSGSHDGGRLHLVVDAEVPGRLLRGRCEPDLLAQDGFHGHPIRRDHLAAVACCLENRVAEALALARTDRQPAPAVEVRLFSFRDPMLDKLHHLATSLVVLVSRILARARLMRRRGLV